MNTTFLVPFFLGTFSGFLATLPIGPAKILAVRKFLLLTKGNENELYNLRSSNTILLASISGLIFAQILFFLALQFPFLYALWVKPHFFSFFFVSILFIYLYQIKQIQFDIYNTQPFLKSGSNFSYQQAAFLETLLLQLLNPVVLPNPVFCRLTNVFLFRYSTLSTFFVGNFLGLLSGYATFFLCTLFLLKRLELDAPTIYKLVKIKIHQFFGIVFVVFSFLCLSRTPLPAIKPFKLKAVPTKFSFTKSLYENFWPDSFFGYDRWKRPLRLIAFDNKKSQATDEIKPFNKMFFSQFFFQDCIKDGKYSLYHNFPQSLSVVSENINYLLKSLPKSSSLSFLSGIPKRDLPASTEGTVRENPEEQQESFEEHQSQKLMDDWIKEKRNRQNQIDQHINTKINQIEKGFVLEELVEKKFSSFDFNKKKISKELDPRLSTDIRGTKLFLKSKSFLFLTKEYLSKKDSLFPIEKKIFTSSYTTNKLKLFLGENLQTLSHSEPKSEKIPFITWKPLEKSFSEETNNLKENLKEDQIFVDRVQKKSDLKKILNTSAWDEIFKKISLSLSSGSGIGQKLRTFETEVEEEENIEELQEENSEKMAKIYKPMPLWNPNFNKQQLDLLKRKSKNKLNLKIFFPKSNQLADRQNFVPPLMPFFRRNEFPGTITSRRGKAVCWNTFQKKPHAPLFVNHLNLLQNFFLTRKKIQINQDVPTRSLQPTSRLFQFLRDYLLSLQAYIRKYLKLPFLIILKNIVRQLFFQPTEWEKDWTDLSKEMYVECDFYGKAVSIGVKLPNFFAFGEPKQIKILNPFQLRFWTHSISQKASFEDSENYSFLNVLGIETKMPFGQVKKSPSFWQLLVERIKLILQYKILTNLSSSTPLSSVDVQKQVESDKVQTKYEAQQKLEREQSKISLPTHRSLKKVEEEKFKNFNQNSSENNLKYKATKTKIINNVTQTKTLSDLNKKEKINRTRTRKYTLKNLSILLQKQWFYFYRFVLKKEREIYFKLKKIFFLVKKLFFQQKTKIFKFFTKLSYNFSRFIRRVCYRFSEFFNFFLRKLTKIQNKNSSNLNLFDINSTKNLSQAYIIHSIWEDMLSRPNITSLMKVWDQIRPLKKNFESFLNEQGILGHEKPENLTEHQWNKWLKNFRGYTPPSLKLWSLWAPDYWTQAVEQYWKELPSSKLESILNQESNNIEKIYHSEDLLNTNTKNLFLEHHLPLFQRAQKQTKLWKFNTLSHNYTEVGNDGDIDFFFIWQPIYFSKKTRDLFHKNSSINVIQQEIRKELPLIQREKNRLEFDINLQTIRQRETFSPVSIRRWKFQKLRTILEKFAKTIIKKPQGGEFSSAFGIGEKNKKTSSEIFKKIENTLFANILENWNSKVLDDELLMYNTVSSILRLTKKNKNVSSLNHLAAPSFLPRGKSNSSDLDFVLLEEIFLPTHLREMRILDCFDFQNENTNIQFRSKLSNSETPDSKTISPTLSFKKKEKRDKLAEIGNIWHVLVQQNQKSIKDRQTIVRFLWPTHRLEDLGCINRFWMGTANQSRFSMLRIHTFPNV